MTMPTNHQFLPAGQPAPHFQLTAIKSERQVSARHCAGLPLALVFHGRETVQAVVEINAAVRPLYPLPSQVTLASIVDLSSVPRLLRRVVTPLLEQAYDEAVRRSAQHIPPGYGPADYIFLLPDWDGNVSRAFAVAHADQIAAVVVLDGKGMVVGSYQGPDPGPATLALVRAARSEP